MMRLYPVSHAYGTTLHLSPGSRDPAVFITALLDSATDVTLVSSNRADLVTASDSHAMVLAGLNGKLDEYARGTITLSLLPAPLTPTGTSPRFTGAAFIARLASTRPRTPPVGCGGQYAGYGGQYAVPVARAHRGPHLHVFREDGTRETFSCTQNAARTTERQIRTRGPKNKERNPTRFCLRRAHHNPAAASA